jgi:hypothetical protein
MPSCKRKVGSRHYNRELKPFQSFKTFNPLNINSVQLEVKLFSKTIVRYPVPLLP